MRLKQNNQGFTCATIRLERNKEGHDQQHCSRFESWYEEEDDFEIEP